MAAGCMVREEAPRRIQCQGREREAGGVAGTQGQAVPTGESSSWKDLKATCLMF